MKTPRDFLLGRHIAAEPKLDEIRKVLVQELNNRDSASRTANQAQSLSERILSSFLGCPKAMWRELVMPSRTIWIGLASVWILIFAANFSMRDFAAVKVAKHAPEMIMTFRQQQQLLSELMGPDDAPVAEAKKSYLPRPASERHLELLIT